MTDATSQAPPGTTPDPATSQDPIPTGRRLMDKFNPHYADGGCKMLNDVQDKLQAGDARMDRIEAALAQNTETSLANSAKLDKNNLDTEEVLDILRLGKSFFRLAGYFGTLVKWTLGIGASILGFWITLKAGGHFK